MNSDKPVENEYSGFKEREVIVTANDYKLRKVDSFAKLLIKIPKRFDTFLQTQKDLPIKRRIIRGGKEIYRFADSRYSVRIESPNKEYYLRSADSLYQLTISPCTFISDENDTVFRKLLPQDTGRLSGEIKIWEYTDENPKFIFKSFIEIDNRPFIIACYQIPSIYRQNKLKLALVGTTRVKKRELIIRAECDAEDTTGFIDNMYRSFLSIRIKENP